VSVIAQQSSPGNEDDFAGVNARGDQGMGFSHEKTTHHFHLLADGGAIEIQSNEPTDAATQEAIRQHLAMIAVKFSQARGAKPGSSRIVVEVMLPIEGRTETYQTLILNIRSADTAGPLGMIGFPTDFYDASLEEVDG
jgi:hypothetical protein